MPQWKHCPDCTKKLARITGHCGSNVQCFQCLRVLDDPLLETVYGHFACVNPKTEQPSSCGLHLCVNCFHGDVVVTTNRSNSNSKIQHYTGRWLDRVIFGGGVCSACGKKHTPEPLSCAADPSHHVCWEVDEEEQTGNANKKKKGGSNNNRDNNSTSASSSSSWLCLECDASGPAQDKYACEKCGTPMAALFLGQPRRGGGDSNTSDGSETRRRPTVVMSCTRSARRTVKERRKGKSAKKAPVNSGPAARKKQNATKKHNDSSKKRVNKEAASKAVAGGAGRSPGGGSGSVKQERHD